MPTSASYSHYHVLEETSPGVLQVVFAEPVNTTVSDNQDGTADGVTVVGDSFTWSPLGSGTLYGLDDQNDPILFDGSFYYLLKNTLVSDGTTINVTTSGSYAYCFGAGTRISSPDGARPVEDLAAGDQILTADGRTVPVRWIGRQTLSTRFAGSRAQPVCISAGALGDGLPLADLTVTADHGMMLGGFVVNAGALVNGTTITLVPLADLPERVTYYHVETADHDVILANGAAAETFVDYAGRAAFDNFADYVALYGHQQSPPEMTRPRITSARQLPLAIRARLGIDARIARHPDAA